MNNDICIIRTRKNSSGKRKTSARRSLKISLRKLWYFKDEQREACSIADRIYGSRRRIEVLR